MVRGRLKKRKTEGGNINRKTEERKRKGEKERIITK
jgi:hypothetical protein